MGVLYTIQVPSKCRFDLLQVTLEHIREGKTQRKLAKAIKQGRRHAHFMCQNCCILGFAVRSDSGLVLTDKGRRFLDSGDRMKGLILAQSILESPVVSMLIKHAGSLEEAARMSQDDITEFLVENTLASTRKTAPIEAVTARRRASSVKRWIEWLVNNAPTIPVNSALDEIDEPIDDLLAYY
ncbi:MAG: hypothetical protein DRP09_17800 [Candidatus Thorarchaeota archaeon]|nr:MAG: hypothetical protein DRP09_17800 [Candidatus Thorarchaeota archaeon]